MQIYFTKKSSNERALFYFGRSPPHLKTAFYTTGGSGVLLQSFCYLNHIKKKRFPLHPLTQRIFYTFFIKTPGCIEEFNQENGTTKCRFRINQIVDYHP